MSATRCANRLYGTGYPVTGVRCARIATGDDGLCNVCRAARKRGEQRSREASERTKASVDMMVRNMGFAKACNAFLDHGDKDRLVADIRSVQDGYMEKQPAQSAAGAGRADGLPLDGAAIVEVSE